MEPFVLYVEGRNKNSGNICPTERQIFALEIGKVGGESFEVVEIRVKGTRELICTWPQTYSHFLIENKVPRYSGYRSFSYIPILQQLVKDATKPPIEEFMTQAEIAEYFNIHQCRVSEFKRYGFLTVHHKDGKTEMYLKSDVMALMQNPYVVTSLENNYERSHRVAA